MRARWLGALALLACAPVFAGGCATCRRDAAPVEPRVTARGSGGARDMNQDARVDFEVSNLLCKPR